MKTDLKKPCSACPFRIKSAAGWLGPWRPGELAWSVMKGDPFPCHQTVAEDCEFDDPQTEGMQACAGAAIFLNNIYALSRDPDMASLQSRLKRANTGDELARTVFSHAKAFVDHHADAPVKSWEQS